MSPDIRDMLQGAAPKPTHPLDLRRVQDRAKRIQMGGRMMMTVGVIAAAGLVATGARFLPQAFDSSGDTREIPVAGGDAESDNTGTGSTMSLKERAAVVALEAMTGAGLRTANDSTFDYQGTSRVEDGWVSKFGRLVCEGTEEEVTCTLDAQVLVHLALEGDEVDGTYGEVTAAQGTLRITDVTGEVAPNEREALVGYTAPVDGGPPQEIFEPLVVDHVTGGNEPSVHAALYWTGPIPSDLESECRLEVLDRAGMVIYEGRSLTFQAPRSEAARDGAITTGFPRNLEWSDVRFACQEWRNEGSIEFEVEPIRPPAGDEEVIGTGTFPDQPSMGVNAGREWKLFGSINDRYWCVRMATPLHDDPGSNSTCAPFELEQQDVIQGSMGTLIERADGEPPSFNFLWGMVRTDVVRVEVGGVEARLIEPPDGFPASFFVAIFPVQKETTIRGFAEDGTELGHRSIRLTQP